MRVEEELTRRAGVERVLSESAALAEELTDTKQKLADKEQEQMDTKQELATKEHELAQGAALAEERRYLPAEQREVTTEMIVQMKAAALKTTGGKGVVTRQR